MSTRGGFGVGGVANYDALTNKPALNALQPTYADVNPEQPTLAGWQPDINYTSMVAEGGYGVTMIIANGRVWSAAFIDSSDPYTNGSVEPDWSTAPATGAEVNDGSLIWTNIGTANGDAAPVPTTWAAETEYFNGQLVWPTRPNGHVYIASDDGPSGSEEPIWPVDGGSVGDGSPYWTDLGSYLKLNYERDITNPPLRDLMRPTLQELLEYYAYIGSPRIVSPNWMPGYDMPKFSAADQGMVFIRAGGHVFVADIGSSGYKSGEVDPDWSSAPNRGDSVSDNDFDWYNIAVDDENWPPQPTTWKTGNYTTGAPVWPTTPNGFLYIWRPSNFSAGQANSTGNEPVWPRQFGEAVGGGAGKWICAGAVGGGVGRGARGNVFIGKDAGFVNSNNANDCVALGDQTLVGHDGDINIAIGKLAMGGGWASGADVPAAGSENIAIGDQALYALKGGEYNIGIGYSVAYQMLEGSNNTIVGHNSALSLNVGSNNTIIGYEADVGAGSDSGSTVIGTGARGKGDNTAVIGSDANFNGLYVGNGYAAIYGSLNCPAPIGAGSIKETRVAAASGFDDGASTPANGGDVLLDPGSGVNGGADGNVVMGRGYFQLGKNATTALIAGALAALTDASLQFRDGTGTLYEIPCKAV